jgi:cyanophycinase
MSATAAFTRPRPRKGPIIAIGGAEHKGDDGNLAAMTVLRGTVHEAAVATGRPPPALRVTVITTASRHYAADLAVTYEQAFRKLGVRDFRALDITTGAQARAVANVERLAGSDLVFFTGGDQERLVGILGGTAAIDAVRAVHEKGGVIAGTSAGAAAMAPEMITGGDPDRAGIRGAIFTAPGFGFIPGVTIDTHTDNINRQRHARRLEHEIARHPRTLGIALSEDTAIILRDDGRFKVMGRGNVLVVDGSRSVSDFAATRPDRPYSLSGHAIQELAADATYNLKTRAAEQQNIPAKGGNGPGHTP